MEKTNQDESDNQDEKDVKDSNETPLLWEYDLTSEWDAYESGIKDLLQQPCQPISTKSLLEGLPLKKENTPLLSEEEENGWEGLSRCEHSPEFQDVAGMDFDYKEDDDEGDVSCIKD